MLLLRLIGLGIILSIIMFAVLLINGADKIEKEIEAEINEKEM